MGPLLQYPPGPPPNYASQAGLPEGRPTCFKTSLVLHQNPVPVKLNRMPARLPASTPVRSPSQLMLSANQVEYVAVPRWAAVPWLWHGFSTRRGGLTQAYCCPGAPGELNLGFTPEDNRDIVLWNRQRFAEAVSGDRTVPIATLRQIHSGLHVIVDSTVSVVAPVCQGDGIMTDQVGILLGVQTADCVPVLVADRRRKVVAAFHAGWRGTVQRIVESGIHRMCLEFAAHPADMTAAIGPAIGPCCYSVGKDVFTEFTECFDYAESLFSKVDTKETDSASALTPGDPVHAPGEFALHLDLFEANRRQLVDAGLPPESIVCVGGCTACQQQLFYSHRASRGRAGRMLSVIGIRPE